MNGSLILLILAVVPMLCAPLAWALGRKGGQRAIAVMIACSAVEVAALICSRRWPPAETRCG